MIKYYTKMLALTLMMVSVSLSAQQVSTPGNGVSWTPDSLIKYHPSSFSFSQGVYHFGDSLLVAANDTFSVSKSSFITLDSAVEVNIEGAFYSLADSVVFTASDSSKPYNGFRFEDGSTVVLRHASFSYGGGLRVLTPNFMADSCAFIRNVSGASTGAAVNFSRGMPSIRHSRFLYNDLPAIASGGNQQVAVQFIGNYLRGNTQSNGNRPQINMGPSGPDTSIIRNNTIIGDRALDMVGGISSSSLFGIEHHVIIDSNLVVDNRYGITIAGGNASGVINANILEDNDSQGQPMLGGSGISLSGSSSLAVEASYNEIRRNLWGITVLGSAGLNLGDTAALNPVAGENLFANNGNGGQSYALYNNTSDSILAMHNCWLGDSAISDSLAETQIFHFQDDATLGWVEYLPLGCVEDTNTTAVRELTRSNLSVYPNPTAGPVNLELEHPAVIEIYSLKGEQVFKEERSAGLQSLELDLSPGIYLLRTMSDDQVQEAKLILH